MSEPVVELSRDQILAHRWLTQGLDRPDNDGDARDLAVWTLGLQDSPPGSAALAMAARLPSGFAAVPDLADARRFVTVWGTRGAPLVLRSGDVDRVAHALWPTDDAGAVATLSGNGQQFRKDRIDPVKAIRVTALTMRSLVTKDMTKGEVSAALTPELPDAYITWCRPCGTHHLGDQLMRVASLAAGLRLVPGASSATLTRIGGWNGVPEEAVGTDEFIAAYLHLCGPAAPKDVTAFLQTSASTVKAAWPHGLVEVRVEGAAAAKVWMSEADLKALGTAPPPEGVRLLPRSDPWLLARDRSLVVPDPAHRKVLWPTLGWPGAVVVDGEVAAAWRTRSLRSGRAVEVRVEPFAPLAAKIRKTIATEAAAVAAQREVDDLQVSFS